MLKLKRINHFYAYLKSLLRQKVNQWYAGLLEAIASLSQMPKRCPLARENEHFSQEIRQLLYGQGRNSYRVIFTILEVQDISTVLILHIRHAYQQTIGEDPESDVT